VSEAWGRYRRAGTGALLVGLCAISRLTAQRVATQDTTPPPGLGTALQQAAIARASRRDSARYDDIFRKYTKRYFGVGFDWRIFKAQGMAESQLNPDARSWVGARGIMQLMPSTFQEIQSKRPEFQSIDDPEWNIAAGIMHDRYLWRLWERGVREPERRHFMFASYNAGEGTIVRACVAARAAQLDDARWASIEEVAPSVRRWRYRETLGYVRRIEQNYGRLQRIRGARIR
jgi:membrane-bound lytic murein transglycosylase F